MCKHFVSTTSRIPYFEEQIKVIDNKIKYATIKHDIEDLTNIKKLLVTYLSKLYELKRDNE